MRRTAFVVFLCMMVPCFARGDGPAEAEARTLNKQGRRQIDEGDFLGALDSFRAAYARYPNANLLLNIGTALRNLGNWAAAAEAYEKYLADPASDPAKKEELSTLLREIEGHLGRLQVVVNEPGTRVLVDGKDLGGSPQSVRMRIEAGTHTIVAEKQGFATAAATVSLQTGEERRIELQMVSAPIAPSSPTTGAELRAPLAIPRNAEPPPPKKSRAWIAGVVVGSVVAAVGIGLGVGLGTADRSPTATFGKIPVQ